MLDCCCPLVYYVCNINKYGATLALSWEIWDLDFLVVKPLPFDTIVGSLHIQSIFSMSEIPVARIVVMFLQNF